MCQQTDSDQNFRQIRQQQNQQLGDRNLAEPVTGGQTDAISRYQPGAVTGLVIKQRDYGQCIGIPQGRNHPRLLRRNRRIQTSNQTESGYREYAQPPGVE